MRIQLFYLSIWNKTTNGGLNEVFYAFKNKPDSWVIGSGWYKISAELCFNNICQPNCVRWAGISAWLWLIRSGEIVLVELYFSWVWEVQSIRWWATLSVTRGFSSIGFYSSPHYPSLPASSAVAACISAPFNCRNFSRLSANQEAAAILRRELHADRNQLVRHRQARHPRFIPRRYVSPHPHPCQPIHRIH